MVSLDSLWLKGGAGLSVKDRCFLCDSVVDLTYLRPFDEPFSLNQVVLHHGWLQNIPLFGKHPGLLSSLTPSVKCLNIHYILPSSASTMVLLQWSTLSLSLSLPLWVSFLCIKAHTGNWSRTDGRRWRDAPKYICIANEVEGQTQQTRKPTGGNQGWVQGTGEISQWIFWFKIEVIFLVHNYITIPTIYVHSYISMYVLYISKFKHPYQYSCYRHLVLSTLSLMCCYYLNLLQIYNKDYHIYSF